MWKYFGLSTVVGKVTNKNKAVGLCSKLLSEGIYSTTHLLACHPSETAEAPQAQSGATKVTALVYLKLNLNFGDPMAQKKL